MTIKEFNTKIINQGFNQIDKHIIFQTPDGKVYTNVEIIPIHQGNEVICKVKLIDNIEPKFKAGDRVKNVSSEYPDKIFVINIVNTSNKCYHYFNSKGIITKFKDQDKLILIKKDEVRPPVEDEDKLDILAKAHANVVKYNTLKYNIEHYPRVYNALKQIIAISKEGAIGCNLIVYMKEKADEDGIYYVEDEICDIIRWHFNKLGYKIKETIKENEYNEFFVTW